MAGTGRGGDVRPLGPFRRGREAAEPRLDPARWRRPGRGTLMRLAAMAALLITAALMSWSGPTTRCPPESSPARDTGGGASTPGGPATTATPRASARGRPSLPHGTVGLPVRLAEPAALALVHSGDRVDLFRVHGTGQPDEDRPTVARGALVLDVTAPDDPVGGGLLLALTPAEADRAVATPAGAGYAVVIRPVP
ncbi:hypothetical protein EV385_2126 [Krasilnikovia cinnamomea]|uniref:Flp pilus assembly protein RcpC/CpaB domain-containing protein n=1 Tax=Krasilnikovia cinnamomea TaxID=349313 RepID=A0A4Q7ZIP9_9ACTN|nr:hypothetical protein [Krasilnikovia cinnamomea]RZU50354.1 hypothetical protein EV385_2126 [Krasilnikovia cinnamomea]